MSKRVRCYQNAISWGLESEHSLDGRLISMLHLLPKKKKNMNCLLTVQSRNLSCTQNSIFLSKIHHKLQHTREVHEKVVEPQKHGCCQICAAGRRGCAQVCSSAYCSLAWVNKEKTGAIRQTCQAWNSLLMFTPFTLGLSQRCCLSDFWQGPTVICFFTESKQTIPVVCHTKHNTLCWQKKMCPRTSALKSLSSWSDTGTVYSRNRQGVTSKQGDDTSVITHT